MIEKRYLCWKESLWSMLWGYDGKLIKIVGRRAAHKWLQQDKPYLFNGCRSIQPINVFTVGTECKD